MDTQSRLTDLIRGEDAFFQLRRVPRTNGFRIESSVRDPAPGEPTLKLTRDGLIIDENNRVVLRQAKIAPHAIGYVLAQAKL